MAHIGIDYAFSKPSPNAIKAAGYTFVCRYLGGSASKDLTATEAKALIAAGIDIVCNWEASASAALGGHAQGVKDATAALKQATACGMPSGRPIYFSVDFDASPAQQAVINAYMDGVASVLGLARTGAYGGYWVISRLFNAKKITWGWQTYAWSGGHWDSRAHIRQIRNGITVGGADCDEDQAQTVDFGQWGSEGDNMAMQDDITWIRETLEWVNRRVEALGRNYEPMQGVKPQQGEQVWAVSQLRKLDDIAAKVSSVAAATGGLSDADRALIKGLTDAVNALNARLASP